MITCVRLTPRFRRVICLIFSFARVMLLGEMPGLPFKSSRWPRNLRSPTADPARDPGHEDIVIYPVEKLFEVELHDKLAPPWATYFRAVPAPCGRWAGPEYIAGVGKGGVEDGVQYPQDRLLNQTVHNHWNTQLALSSSRLRDRHSTHGPGPVSPVQQCSRQRRYVFP